MTEEEMIKAHCLLEVTARREFAEKTSPEWRAEADADELKLLNDALNKPLDEQVEDLYVYWHFRAFLSFKGVDSPQYARALEEWDAVLHGNPIEGKYSHYQKLAAEQSDTPSPGL